MPATDINALIEQGKTLAEDLEEIEGISSGEDFGILSSIRSEQIQYYRESSAAMLRLYAEFEAKDAEIARLREALNTVSETLSDADPLQEVIGPALEAHHE